jgi:hypothetical protein
MNRVNRATDLDKMAERGQPVCSVSVLPACPMLMWSNRFHAGSRKPPAVRCWAACMTCMPQGKYNDWYNDNCHIAPFFNLKIIGRVRFGMTCD